MKYEMFFISGLELATPYIRKIVPDQILVAGICYWVEIVSSEHFHISECPGLGIHHFVNEGSINCNGEINLKNKNIQLLFFFYL